MIPNPVVWFEIYVQDMPRARAFYEAMLGTALSRLPGTELEMWAFPMVQGAPGSAGALVHMPGMPSGGSTLVYFSCQDCAAHAERARAAGGRVQQPKMSIGEYGHIALVVDTEGNMVGLHSMQ